MNPVRLASFLLASGIAMASAIYDITDLGSLGGANAQAFGLNSSGQAVGASSTIFGYQHAFSSSGSGSGSGMIDLTAGTPAAEGQAAAVNDTGQIAGTQYAGGQAFATLWSGGTAQPIGAAGSYGMAINGAGEMAGMFTTSDGQGHAFRTVNGVAQDLGALPGGTWSSAYGINGSGQVAGYGNTSGGVFRAFIWSPGSGYSVLGTLGGANSYAMAINDAGQVAGSAQAASGYMHAFLWNGTLLVDLGTLGGGSSYAYGINSAGDVVGYSWLSAGANSHAFLFEDGIMFDLNSLIDPSSGWVLTQAYAINANGQIVGSGLLDGVEHAFRLDYKPGFTDASPIPEPATWIVVLTGLAGVAACGLRSRIRPRPRPSGPRLARRRSTASPA